MEGGKSVELAYDVFSPGHDPDDAISPVILIHGLMSSRSTWKDMPRDIADIKKRKVYALDARNHGESGWTDEFNHELLVKDLENFMEEKRIPRAIFIGHSMGGYVAMSLALSKPEKVEKLIIEDMTPMGTPRQVLDFLPEHFLLRRQALTFVNSDMDLDAARKVISQFLNSNLSKSLGGVKPKAVDDTTLPIRKLDDGSYAWMANIDVLEDALINKHCLSEKLQGLYDGHTLFICGTQSPFQVCDDKDNIVKLFPNSVFIPVIGAAHRIHDEFPEEFLKAVLVSI